MKNLETLETLRVKGFKFEKFVYTQESLPGLYPKQVSKSAKTVTGELIYSTSKVISIIAVFVAGKDENRVVSEQLILSYNQAIGIKYAKELEEKMPEKYPYTPGSTLFWEFVEDYMNNCKALKEPVTTLEISGEKIEVTLDKGFSSAFGIDIYRDTNDRYYFYQEVELIRSSNLGKLFYALTL